jgi:hypothetical protein
MLLQIQVYPAIDGAQKHQPSIQSIEPAITHYINTSILPIPTGRNENPESTTDSATATSTNNSNTTNTLWSMGRKVGDYCVTTDRSVSREHVRLLRWDTATAKDGDDNTTISHESGHNNLIQIESVGKLGCTLVIEDTYVDTPEETDGVKEDDGNMKGNDANDDDSDTTVDESYFSKYRNSRHSRNTYRSSQHQRSSQQSIQDDMDLSYITKHLTQQALESVTTRTTTPRWKYNVQLQDLAPNDTITVGFYDNETDASTVTTSHTCDHYYHPNRIILQCGTSGTTIVMTRIQLRFVGSGLSTKQFLSKLQWDIATVLGGTVQESFCCPQTDLLNIQPDDYVTDRTYLISTEYHGNPKHVIAWCRNIPVVLPSFVSSLIDKFQNKVFQSSHLYTNDTSPFPSKDFVQQHASPIPKKELKHFEQTPNPLLWKTCTLLSPLNDSNQEDDHDTNNNSTLRAHFRNEQELNEMIQAAGAQVITLQSFLKEDDIVLRKKESFEDKEESESTIRQILDGALAGHTKTISYFTLDTSLMNIQYPMARSMLQNLYYIPSLTTKEVAVAITEQKDIHDRICRFYEDQLKQKQMDVPTDESTTVEQHCDRTLDKTPVTKIKTAETSENDATTDKSSGKRSAVPVSTRPKRTRGAKSTTEADQSNKASHTISTPIQHNRHHGPTAIESRATSTRRRRQAIAPNDVSFQSLNMNNNTVSDDSIMLPSSDASPGITVAQSVELNPTNVADVETIHDDTAALIGGQTDECDDGVPVSPPKKYKATNTEGWFTALKQGSTRKKVYNANIKNMTRTKTSGDDDNAEIITVSEPAATQTMKGMVVKPVNISSQLHIIQRAGPNYKAFRKNAVPLLSTTSVVGLQPYRSKKSRIVLVDDAQRSQAEEQQRRADDLFR